MAGEELPFLPPLTARHWFYSIQIFEQLSCPEKQSCSETFHCVEIFFIFQHYWATSACPEKQTVPWILCIEYIFLILIIQNFEQLALALKNRVCPEIFHCIEIFFIFQDLWGTCACPENRVCHENFSLYLIYFSHSEFLNNFCLPWKTECALNSQLWICIFFIQNFEQFALALKNSLSWNFSLYLI